ncbi:MAG: imidazole glycerol phosphate synthase subunit HisF [Gammaproteobacteria bacterium]|jgi:cyclase|nr:imidazole glycerol phosphate synthase subunit HisF [Gammaproteobacteria bacterium]
MLKKRIIPCLDVKDGVVVKGVKFREHEIIGDILTLSTRYVNEGADELVFYDITATAENRTACAQWVAKVASQINIPFCVAGGIRTLAHAERLMESGADKVSINSPALENPALITELAKRFGSQSVVVGIDSFEEDGEYHVFQYTGDPNKSQRTHRTLLAWAHEVEDRGAGEIVLNCMNQDGIRQGYDIPQLQALTETVVLPVIASGGAGNMSHFHDLFTLTKCNGALAASVFHKELVHIGALKQYLRESQIPMRMA